MVEVFGMKQPVKVFTGDIGKRHANILKKMLIGEVEHPIGRSGPRHCGDQINDRVEVPLFFQLDPPDLSRRLQAGRSYAYSRQDVRRDW